MRRQKLVFASNYFNHHQKPLSEEFIKIYGDGYTFLAFTPFNQKRIVSGWHDMNQEPCVFRAYESPEAKAEAEKIIEEADVAILGDVGFNIDRVKNRAKNKKITFHYSERIFKIFRPSIIKKILSARFSPLHRHVLKRKLLGNTPLHSEYTYLLSAGAFTSWDFELLGYYGGRAYRWGYFPELKRYDDIEALISRKKKNSILWAGRFLDLKHPDLAVILAKNLKAENIPFNITITGAGEMSEKISRMVDEFNLRDCVELTGTLTFQQVREKMEQSQIFLFTSDKQEGWGVVCNEAMNSACTVVASDRIGSVPYLIENGHNGFIFRENDAEDLTRKVTSLLKEPVKSSELGRNAYNTMCELWSPEVVASRFVRLSEALSSGKSGNIFDDDGPCSPAPLMSDRWFRK